MSRGTMNLVPLLYVIGALEGSLLFLIRGLLVAIPTISTVLSISSVNGVDLPIILLS
jgi:hypothetical protein